MYFTCILLAYSPDVYYTEVFSAPYQGGMYKESENLSLWRTLEQRRRIPEMSFYISIVFATSVPSCRRCWPTCHTLSNNSCYLFCSGPQSRLGLFNCANVNGAREEQCSARWVGVLCPVVRVAQATLIRQHSVIGHIQKRIVEKIRGNINAPLLNFPWPVKCVGPSVKAISTRCYLT